MAMRGISSRANTRRSSSRPATASGRCAGTECVGNPENTKDWVGRDLLERDMIHGHSLCVADIDGDGQLDIFAAEMAKWS